MDLPHDLIIALSAYPALFYFEKSIKRMRISRRINEFTSIIEIVMRKPEAKRRGYSSRNRLQFVPGGSAFFSVLRRLIDQAQESIHIQVYIFLDDKTGNEIGDALIDAARRNINVYLLVDGYGSRKLSKSFIAKIKDAGISFSFFFTNYFRAVSFTSADDFIIRYLWSTA